LPENCSATAGIAGFHQTLLSSPCPKTGLRYIARNNIPCAEKQIFPFGKPKAQISCRFFKETGPIGMVTNRAQAYIQSVEKTGINNRVFQQDHRKRATSPLNDWNSTHGNGEYRN
jgi:hypothetical protein